VGCCFADAEYCTEEIVVRQDACPAQKSHMIDGSSP
jgi:hypothetical protein